MNGIQMRNSYKFIFEMKRTLYISFLNEDAKSISIIFKFLYKLEKKSVINHNNGLRILTYLIPFSLHILH